MFTPIDSHIEYFFLSFFKIEEQRDENLMWWDSNDVFGKNGLLPENENKENFIGSWHACYKDHDIIMVAIDTILIL